jgi:pantothenate kinase type III
VGRDTEEAIRAGLVVGLRGLVAALVGAARRAIDGRALVVATGGDARLLVPSGSRVVPDLALRGIAAAHARAIGDASAARRGPR